MHGLNAFVVFGFLMIFLAGLGVSPPLGFAKQLKVVLGYALVFAVGALVTLLVWYWIASGNQVAMPAWSLLVAAAAGTLFGLCFCIIVDPTAE